MENKINIAELLKDCPKGMELDCTMYDNCTFDGIEDVGYIEILVKTPSGQIRLTKEGCFIRHDEHAKCIIFPKGKDNWEGFVPPCQFKDGDVVYTVGGSIAILGDIIGEHSDSFRTYYGLFIDGLDTNVIVSPERLATEKEKQKLFNAIKANGYKWNEKTKTLEKLPEFKAGDKIRHKGSGVYCTLGEFIKSLNGYRTNIGLIIRYDDINNWELAPNKFDITTLKPFNKVLVRNNGETWCINLFGYYNKINNQYNCIGNTNIGWDECIIYEGNEHLLGTTDDCDEFYKTWK